MVTASTLEEKEVHLFDELENLKKPVIQFKYETFEEC